MGVYESLPVDAKRFGFRIYNLSPNGPLHQAGVKEFSDFLIPPNEVYENKKPFSDWVSQHAGQKINLQLYSLRTRVFTSLEIKANPSNSKEGFLGAAIRYENWSIAHKNVLHVLDVREGSFAKEKLKLIPYEDYIIAMKPDGGSIISLNIEGEDPMNILSKGIKDNKGHECEFYIYNVKNGGRIAHVKIDDDDYFQLGCDVAYGKLHEFPLENNNKEDNEDIKIENEKVTPHEVTHVKNEDVVYDQQRIQKEMENYQQENKVNNEMKEESKKTVKEEKKEDNKINNENKDNDKK